MTQPPKGPGALPLLLRLSMLRSRQRGGGSLAERGYSLAVALIASFVLLLGVGALASRGSLGFIGQAFQVQNRQARAVAEAAIAEFADGMNREPNRALLIAGGPNAGNWGALDARNVCTVYDNAGGLIGNKSDLRPADYAAPEPAFIGRFTPNAGQQVLVADDPTRTFVVESVEYRKGDADRTVFLADNIANKDSTSDGYYRREVLQTGVERSLIRVTIVGSIARGNRTSTARLAREFEVVPKCCKRSFGAQAGFNWGRDDTEPCSLETEDGGRGFILGLGGAGRPNGMNAPFDIKDDRGFLSQAICWGGLPNGATSSTDPDSIYANGVPSNPACATSGFTIGKNAGPGTATTFTPAFFDISLPSYAKEIPDDWLATQNIDPIAPSLAKEVQQAKDDPGYFPLNTGSGQQYIYFNTINRKLQICDVSGPGINNCRPLAIDPSLEEPLDPADPLAVRRDGDVCYERLNVGTTFGTRRPIAEVNCRLSQIISGNQVVFVDTSDARINLFFDNPSSPPAGDFLDNGGNTDFRRVHCRWPGVLFPQPGLTSRCTSLLEWTSANGRDFQAFCDPNGTSPCGLVTATGTQYNLDYYDTSELLNIFATASGAFDLRGSSTFTGNIYAPNATIQIRGGGGGSNPVPNLVGRIWANQLVLRGGGNSLSLRIPRSAPSFLSDDSSLLSTIDYWDFMARSFTQSSGF